MIYTAYLQMSMFPTRLTCYTGSVVPRNIAGSPVDGVVLVLAVADRKMADRERVGTRLDAGVEAEVAAAAVVGDVVVAVVGARCSGVEGVAGDAAAAVPAARGGDDAVEIPG